MKRIASSSGGSRGGPESAARETSPQRHDADLSHAGGAANGSSRGNRGSGDRFTNSFTQGESVQLPPIKTRGIELPSSSTHVSTSRDHALVMNTLANAAGARDMVPMTQVQERRLSSENSYLPLTHDQSRRESSDHGNYDKRTKSTSSATFRPESLTTQGDSHSQSHAVRGANYLPPIVTATSQPSATLSSSSSPGMSLQNTRQDELATLESQLHRLRQYAEELLSLSLHESHQLLQREIQSLEQRVLSIKRERSEKLLHGLESEFPALVGLREGIKKEGSKLGYF